jgi:hypothetical protein
MQVIIPEWRQELKAKLAAAETLQNRAQQFPPGDKFEGLWDDYVTECKTVVAFVEQRYESVPDLMEFMKQDIRNCAKPYNLVTEEYLNWDNEGYSMPAGQESTGIVQMIGSNLSSYDEAKYFLDRAIAELAPSSSQPKLGMS